MNTLKYCSTQEGYSASLKSGVITQELDGGAPRSRRGLKNGYHTVNVQWKVLEDGFQYLDAFYNVWCEAPNQKFSASLRVNGPEFKPYECLFVADSFQLSSMQGPVYTVTAQLRVKPIVDSELNKIIVETGNDGKDLASLFNPLEELVNDDLPRAMEGI
ncbi:hypothetical protein JUNP543_1072 [Acinetobacter baumannii]|uniref:hypothetical protein n=1 Tax=Acinetobacter baumannii TaxID=470 RepID=UPI00066E0CA0|nr:hypothetical protein [Acinetobacter baumannii]KMV03165.1 hypothetical protein AB994_1908 [Acinetobacter baumannii]KMV09177.1 hypothetical protein AB994_3895 [Acinetobacter baumannii]MEE1860156.1 hypothetical protein [Acinetobacter baumannii]HAV6047457.1 hypothetical protein [Acinetobacter baumannii]HAV6055895.1 hypothetical protein [Acinetobacter baumannii]